MAIFFSKHLIFTSLALIIMILIQIDTKILRFIIPLFIISFLFLVLVPLIGVSKRC